MPQEDRWMPEKAEDLEITWTVVVYWLFILLFHMII